MSKKKIALDRPTIRGGQARKKPVPRDPSTCPLEPGQCVQNDGSDDRGQSFADISPHGSGGGLND